MTGDALCALMVCCVVQACGRLGPDEDSTNTVEVEGAAHLGLLTTKPFLRALAAVLEVPDIPAEAGLRGAAHGSGSVAQAMPFRLPRWDGVAAAAGVLRSEVSGGGGGEEDEGRGLVARMHGAAAAVVAAGCEERQRLEGLLAEGGALAEWEEAALAWHRLWHDCGRGPRGE